MSEHELASQLISVTLEDGPLDECMTQRFPWMLALSSESRIECSRALVDAARASFSTGQPHLAIAELTSWRETATALAAGLGTESLEWYDEPRAVERP